MSDSEWCEVDEDEGSNDEWEIPNQFVEGYNYPIPPRWVDNIFQTRLNVSLSITALKGFAANVYDDTTQAMRSLTVNMTDADINGLMQTVNQIWSQARLRFNLLRYGEITPQSRYEYTSENWEMSYARILKPFESLDIDAQINVFVVPYITHGVSGTTALWNGHGIDRRCYILLSANNALDLLRESLPRLSHTLAHEIGHALHLEHHPNPTHLMYQDDTRTETILSPAEIKFARSVSVTIRPPREWGVIRTRSMSEDDFESSPDAAILRDPTLTYQIQYAKKPRNNRLK